MSELSGCPSCQGFNPPSATACLHCGHVFPRRPSRLPRHRLASLCAFAGVGVASVTLMACYGMPCMDAEARCVVEPPTDCHGWMERGPDGGQVLHPCDAGAPDAGDVDAGLQDAGVPDGGVSPP